MMSATAETYAQRLEQTWPELRDRVERAARAAGRSPSSVRVVAVTKSHPLEAVDAALAAGLRDLGENRVEELEQKVAARGRDAVTWHMIGHVQSRKAKRVVDLAHLTHSVDSERLADRMSKIKAAGTEKIGFVWAGSTEKGQRYHYRVQGPTFLIEHNNTQNQGNHIHSVWRDFNGDFGRDLLAEHLKALPH